MKRFNALGLGLCVAFGCAAADDAIVTSAMSAAPASISADARIMDWDFNVIREGSNGWTCLPDRPNTPGNDPWCVTEAWLNFLNAYVSNTDPYATDATGPEDWVTDLGPLLMLLNPDRSLLSSISTDHLNGGPWVMWPDTPYAHIMVPLENRGR